MKGFYFKYNDDDKWMDDGSGKDYVEKIRLAREHENDYLNSGYRAILQYMGLSRKVRGRPYKSDIHTRLPLPPISTRYNMFYANVEALASLILPVVPLPIVSARRLSDSSSNMEAKKFYKVCASVIENALTYFTREIDMDTFENFKYDYLIPGRGILWIEYAERRNRQFIKFKCVSWEDFAIDPKESWEDVRWIARRKLINRNEFKKNFPDVPLSRISWNNYRFSSEGIEDYFPTEFTAAFSGDDHWCEIWELWDKDEKKAMFVSRQFRDEVIKEIKIDIDEEYFFPTPNPLLAVRNRLNMIPQSEYWTYWHELQELSEESYRKAHLVRAINAKSIIDAQDEDVVKALNKPGDGYIISVAGRKLNKDQPIFEEIDNSAKVATIEALTNDQMRLKDTINSITGLDEMVRKVSPDTSATESRYRSKFGSKRLQKRQIHMADYIKRVYRLAAAIMARYFTAETYQEITPINLRRQEEVAQELQSVEQAHQQTMMQLQQLQNPQPQQGLMDQGPGGEMQGPPQDQQGGQNGNDAQMASNPGPSGPDNSPTNPNGNPQADAQRAQEAQQQQQQMMQQQQQQMQQQQQQQMQQLQLTEMDQQKRIETLRNETTWDDVTAYLNKEGTHRLTMDIETDFERIDDDPIVMQERNQALQAFVQNMNQVLPMIPQNPDVGDVMEKVLSWAVDGLGMPKMTKAEFDEFMRKFVLQAQEKARHPQQNPPAPEVLVAQASMLEAQAKMLTAQVQQQKVQLEAQLKGQELQMKGQIEQMKASAQGSVQAGIAQQQNDMKMQIEQMKLMAEDKRQQGNMAVQQVKLEQEQAKTASKIQSDQIKSAQKEKEIQLKGQIELQKAAMDIRKEHLKSVNDQVKLRMTMQQKAMEPKAPKKNNV
jgi:hypothetical protein